jgi:hypothetical protein
MTTQNNSTSNSLFNWPITGLKAVLCGFCTSLLIAVFHVYQSNIHLYHKFTSLQETDFLLVPTSDILPNFQHLSTAFGGGLFFSFSIGLALALLSYGVFITLRCQNNQYNFLKKALVLLWGVWLVFLYKKGGWVQPGYFFLVPVAVAATMNRKCRITPLKAKQIVGSTLLFILFAGLFVSLAETNIFISVRDNVLLSNPAGSKLNDFYYKYTLYPAESFKSLDQKLIKTYLQQGTLSQDRNALLTQRLIAHDYLPVHDITAADLVIAGDINKLSFMDKGRKVLQIDTQEFLDQPAIVLRKFSEATDHNRLFRQLVYYSIIFNMIAIPYLLVHYFLQTCFLLLIKRTLPWSAATFCSLCIISFPFFFLLHGITVINQNELSTILEDDSWRKRVAGLRFIASHDLEISRYNYKPMLTSPYVPERYWLARSLGNSKNSATYEDLMTFLDDPHPNVVCMGLYSLGRRGQRMAIDVIKNKIRTSDHWYEQMYGYKALRSIGWDQTWPKRL